jgi:hypothetical protein
MSAYTNHENTSVKRNSGQKSALTERDRRILRRIISKNRRTTAVQVTAVLNIHLEDPVSAKTVRLNFKSPTSTVALQLLNF